MEPLEIIEKFSSSVEIGVMMEIFLLHSLEMQTCVFLIFQKLYQRFKNSKMIYRLSVSRQSMCLGDSLFEFNKIIF